MHSEAHPQAGKTVKLVTGEEYRLEDWWDRVSEESWMFSQTPAAFNYAVDVIRHSLPLDDEVVYGKIGAFGYLMHVSQLDANSFV